MVTIHTPYCCFLVYLNNIVILKKTRIFLVQLPATFHFSTTKKKDLKRSYCCTLESGLDFLWEEINENGGVIVDERNDYGGKEAPA